VSSCLRGIDSPGIFIEDLVLAIFSVGRHTQFMVFFGDFDLRWWFVGGGWVLLGQRSPTYDDFSLRGMDKPHMWGCKE